MVLKHCSNFLTEPLYYYYPPGCEPATTPQDPLHPMNQAAIHN